MHRSKAVKGLLLCALALACCTGGRIPKSDFTDILTEMQIASAYFASEGITFPFWKDTIPYNHHIVESHGYTWASFDSTVSWYCKHPRKYQDIYDDVVARLTAMEASTKEEPNPPEELWKMHRSYCLPASDIKQDSIPVDVMLKGVGRYVISADIRLYPEDGGLLPQIELYWWRTDKTDKGYGETFRTTALSKYGLPIRYTYEAVLQPGNEFTHLKGNLLAYKRNVVDSTQQRRVEIDNISVMHYPMNFDAKK